MGKIFYTIQYQLPKASEFGIEEIDVAAPVLAEAATRGVLWKKLILRISQYSHENICVGVSF